MKLFKAACFAIVIAAVVTGLAAYPLLPASVPTHWNAAGEVDDFGPRWISALLFPAIMALILLLFIVIPKIAVFHENLRAFEKQYWALGFVLQLYFAMFYAMVLAAGLGFNIGISQPVVLLIAFLFMAIGALMPSFKRNFFVGIRTPWTLANDRVWEKTHKLGGKLFIASGIVALLSLLAPKQAILIAIVPALASAAIAVLYSFLLYRRIGKRQL